MFLSFSNFLFYAFPLDFQRLNLNFGFVHYFYYLLWIFSCFCKFKIRLYISFFPPLFNLMTRFKKKCVSHLNTSVLMCNTTPKWKIHLRINWNWHERRMKLNSSYSLALTPGDILMVSNYFFCLYVFFTYFYLFPTCIFVIVYGKKSFINSPFSTSHFQSLV